MNQAQKILQIAQKYNNTDDLLMSMYGISSDGSSVPAAVQTCWTVY